MKFRDKMYQHSQTPTKVVELQRSSGVNSMSLYPRTALRLFGVIHFILLCGVIFPNRENLQCNS